MQEGNKGFYAKDDNLIMPYFLLKIVMKINIYLRWVEKGCTYHKIYYVLHDITLDNWDEIERAYTVFHNLQSNLMYNMSLTFHKTTYDKQRR